MWIVRRIGEDPLPLLEHLCRDDDFRDLYQPAKPKREPVTRHEIEPYDPADEEPDEDEAEFLEKQDTLVGVTYFTAPMIWNADKYRRHREYITALIAQRVTVVESRFLKSTAKSTRRFSSADSVICRCSARLRNRAFVSGETRAAMR